MEPTEDEDIEFEAPCNCGALGDHPRNPNCAHTGQVQIELTGGRSACLEALGVLRAHYHVFPEHEWQDPNSEEWVFQLSAVRDPWRPLVPHRPFTTEPEPTPEDAVLACLHDALGLEMDENAIGALANLHGETLSTTLTALVKVGKIEHVRPGYYRKNS
ncbi:hypothetical protein ACIQWR_39000 [Streptomyces sp. NPDC098789]|uniref:hypothetical protein n=1 Tax=Streptomyces sp. NPDC098789 TaxID=3366098 RepID=UPI0038207DC6